MVGANPVQRSYVSRGGTQVAESSTRSALAPGYCVAPMANPDSRRSPWQYGKWRESTGTGLRRRMTSSIPGSDHPANSIALPFPLAQLGCVAFQPIVKLSDGRVDHFEALLRPFLISFKNVQAYIVAAEELGMILLIDFAMARYAAQIMSASHYVTRPQIAVNLSGRSLNNGSFRHKFMEQAKDWAQGGAKLQFELTETWKIADLKQTKVFLQALRNLGFEVAMDDYGSGAADERYLSELDFDSIKIDGSLIQAAKTTAGRRRLIAVVRQLKTSNVKIIAERIDDTFLLNLMRDLGVDFGQGYLFSRARDESVLASQGRVMIPRWARG